MNPTLKIKLLSPSATIPTKAYNTDLGYDLYADSSGTIEPGETVSVFTGIAFGFPPGIGGIIKDRSSMARRGLTTSGGVIDSAYTGEIQVLLTLALNGEPYKVEHGARIAQIILTPIVHCTLEEVDELGESDRGSNGFGSSGK